MADKCNACAPTPDFTAEFVKWEGVCCAPQLVEIVQYEFTICEIEACLKCVAKQFSDGYSRHPGWARNRPSAHLSKMVFYLTNQLLMKATAQHTTLL
jgi:hypothetical protein